MPKRAKPHRPPGRKPKPPSEQRRLNAQDRGYNWAWQKASKAFLRRHPLCAECRRRGELTPARVVDHVVPHRGDQVLFWDEGNWQGLCVPCHNRKTRRGE